MKVFAAWQYFTCHPKQLKIMCWQGKHAHSSPVKQLKQREITNRCTWKSRTTLNEIGCELQILEKFQHTLNKSPLCHWPSGIVVACWIIWCFTHLHALDDAIFANKHETFAPRTTES